MQAERPEPAEEAEFRSQGLVLEEVPPSDLQEKGGTASKAWSLSSGSIFIQNDTGAPVMVYYRPIAKRVPKKSSAGFNIGVGFDGLAGVGGERSAEYEQIQFDINSSVIVDPSKPKAFRQSHPISVIGPSRVSIQRMTPDGETLLNKWDCMDMPVKPGWKLVVRGTTFKIPV